MGVPDTAPGPAGGRASEARPPSVPQRATHLVDNGTQITVAETMEKPANPTNVQLRPEATGTSDQIILRQANNSAL